MNSTAPASRRIPALWVVIGIPLATIVASIITVTMAFRESEPELPAQYPWEGAALDQDLARAERARELGLAASLRFTTSGGVIVQLSTGSPGAALPERLELQATHVTLPSRDRAWTLRRDAGGQYRADGAALDRGPWLLQLSAGDWRIRGRLEAGRGELRLGPAARAGEAP